MILSDAILAIALFALAAWVYLALLRDFFWLARESDTYGAPERTGAAWPSVVAVVPARDEAEMIVQTLPMLLAQDYPGAFRVVLVDDDSSDGTGDIARGLAVADRLRVVRGAERPPGWTGKLWALKQGVLAANADGAPEFLWFTDADIAHAPDTLRSLVGRAEGSGLVMVSLMARLNCVSAAEKFLIPAFVFFFEMLYPFGAVNDPKDGAAAAAGGCILARRQAFEKAGGIDTVKHEIIDDCALGRRMKTQGPIWLGFTDRAVSLRRYERLADIRAMVSRSAYAQLRYSPLLLAGTIAGMAALYAAPPLIAIFGDGPARGAAALAWLVMAVLFQPMLWFYRRNPFWGFALPVIGVAYAAFTVDSAVQVWRGRGGRWKGRIQAMGNT
jgi:hopene-associated glycosyltransferase HpnB